MAVESACIPLPSEVIMPFAGYLVYAGRFSSLAVVATLGAIGCNLGSVLAYEVGAYGGRPLIERFGKYILMNRHDLDVSDRFFQKYGSITVFLGRLLPVVRTFIALPAGIARMTARQVPSLHLCRLLALVLRARLLRLRSRRALGYRSAPQAVDASLRCPHRPRAPHRHRLLRAEPLAQSPPRNLGSRRQRRCRQRRSSRQYRRLAQFQRARLRPCKRPASAQSVTKRGL